MASPPRSELDEIITTDVGRAADVIRDGGLVAIPTETVYGLAADITNPAAVRRIYTAKGRPADHPLIVHIAGPDELDDWTPAVPAAARVLTRAAWPGPLTVLVPRPARVPDAVTGGRDTVGLRVPAHPMALDLLRRVGTGLAAPSANRFGSVSPTTAAHVLDELGTVLDPGRDVILDGGACPVGVESTIVDCATTPPQILRAGGVPVEDVVRLLEGDLAVPSGPSRASGMLASHYAPAAAIVLADSGADARRLHESMPDAEVLDLTDDLVAYARDLYARMRDADRRGVRRLIAVLPPPVGLGHAIRDRLAKAAAPRPAR